MTEPSKSRPRSAAESGKSGLLRRLLAQPNDSTAKTVLVTVGLCLVCSVIVSVAAVLLKPLQLQNKALDKQQNILEVAGLLSTNAGDAVGVAQSAGTVPTPAGARIEARVIDLASGRFAEGIAAATYDQRRAARDPAQSTTVADAEDIAGINRRAKYATVYFVREAGDTGDGASLAGDITSDSSPAPAGGTTSAGGNITKLILPVHGYGLWSTLYGFVSLEADGNTVYRIKFYEHAETPGLGGEVDNPRWRAAWAGKQLFNAEGEFSLKVIKGLVNRDAPGTEHRIDGLSGATITSRGITNLFRYWFGEQGFAPFLREWHNGLRPQRP